jgi:hypothetical protein
VWVCWQTFGMYGTQSVDQSQIAQGMIRATQVSGQGCGFDHGP